MDRGVSETLGFVLVFALIVSTIGVVYGTGLGGVDNARSTEKVQNVERAFDVLTDNLEDLHRAGATSRATEVRLAGGSLSMAEPIEVRVEAVEVGNLSNNVTYLTTIEPISYRDDDGTSILYANGAVLRSESAGSVMLDRPGWVVSRNRSVVPMVSTSAGGTGVGGSGTVLVVADRGSRSLNGPFDGNGNTVRVNVTVRTDRAAAWQRYFEDESMTAFDDDPTDGNVTYSFETRRLYVPKTSIQVDFDR